jgi:phage virion morphogenesis protein
MQDMKALTDWCDGLLAQLEPAQRRKLLRAVATELRKSNMQRIKAQVQPDGTAFEARKQSKNLRGQKRGRVKAMFAKLRTASNFKVEATADRAALGFTGRAGRIARVHHYGLRDRVRAGGPEYKYPKRELLGVSPSNQQQLAGTILGHLLSKK